MRIAWLESGLLQLVCDTEHEQASFETLIKECPAADQCKYNENRKEWVTTQQAYEAVLSLYEQYRAAASLGMALSEQEPAGGVEERGAKHSDRGVPMRPPVEHQCTQTDNRPTAAAHTQTPIVIVPPSERGTINLAGSERNVPQMERSSSTTPPPSQHNVAPQQQPVERVSSDEAAGDNDRQTVRSGSTYSGYNTYPPPILLSERRFGLSK